MLQDGQALPSALPDWRGGEHDSRPTLPGSAERLLLDAVRRALHGRCEGVALVLHLARLAPPGPQPHHRRIARALLIEAAGRHEGQLFSLCNGDLVLLSRSADAPVSGPGSAEPAALPAVLSGLFAALGPEPGAMLSVWPFRRESDRLLAYAEERCAAAERIGSSPPAAAQALPGIATAPGLSELLQRRTAVSIARLSPGSAPALRPLFREIGFFAPALMAQHPLAPDGALDPWLLRHVTGGLDEPLLALLEARLAGTGALGMSGAAPGFALHLAISLQTILRDRFAGFVALSRSLGVTVGIEVSLVEAITLPEAFARARSRIRSNGFTLVLGGISFQTLLLTRPGVLGADLMKLEWSPRLASLREPECGELAAQLAAIGSERLVLAHADSEAAVRWGLSRGVSRFLGRHVEVMLAARRMLTCAAAPGCTLGQCTERAGAAGAAGRRFCRNHALLDATTSRPPPE